jgi:DMSO/TMAO reductase YedYZ molybdopterin-dependent catalytic subunit
MAGEMAEERDEPPESKLTRTKQRWAREGRFLTGRTSRPDERRLPPGQHLTMDWPMLDLGLTPNISRERWRLDVYARLNVRFSGIFHSSLRIRRRNPFPTFTA